MNTPAGTRKAEAALPLPEHAGFDLQLQRICRLGRRLFGVLDCVVTFDGVTYDGEMSAETAFCHNMPLKDEVIVVLDTRHHLSLRQHPGVSGLPFIRFYASHPIYGRDKGLMACISLIDRAPRSHFGDDEWEMLADLAALVERELVLRSISESQLDLEKKNKNLRRKSLIDPLLGTWNRGAIMRLLEIASVRCDKESRPLSLIVVDLDHFKRINDTYGHPAGDTVLVKVASRLRSCIRPQESLGRYGGEEFLVVLPGASYATALVVAERMRQAVASQPETVGSATLHLTISAGVASTDMFPAASAEELISRADMALYVAKDQGRNRVVNASPDLS